MLNYPGEALVLQADFLLMVERVDVCIEWFQEHVRTPMGPFTRRISYSGLPSSVTLLRPRSICSDSNIA